MKKYTIENCEEFCSNALGMPPLEEFDDGSIDAKEWYESHKIHITVGNHDIALEYNADNVTEIDSALKEIYEMEIDFRASHNDTTDSEYRPAELKDIIRVAVQKDWDHFGYKLDSFAEFIQGFIKKKWDLVKVMWYYDIILEDIKDYNNHCKCNFGRLDMSKMKNIDSVAIKNAIDELICTDRELMYAVSEDDKSYDIIFVMDYTLKPSGELIGWFYGEPDEEYIADLVDDYKKKLFGEAN